ncbi:phosphotyrosine protein phosphatase [Marinithermofilum abyssi]|uniref:protein-tyrosine-phosphatase n=1 Tax=Marinithermofilum abyssi TaxID=1571185 RepID=A0A8J2VC16_9BACL|nr:low molecular weight protein-tyrosine-phosphatase [Marinithermofilum abyssi]GGE18718.1 phosphotyrosine protein phosphatase [Marinithermofilum abyssi]
MVSVLFVCLGNICRSPMAEAIFRHQVKEAGLESHIRVDSAGTGDWHVGEPPHKGTRKVLAGLGISDEGIRARQVTREDLDDFDYIVAMDDQNISSLRQLAGDPDTKVYRLTDFIPDTAYNEVPDPYFTGDFDETYRLVEAGCRGLLQTIRDKENI